MILATHPFTSAWEVESLPSRGNLGTLLCINARRSQSSHAVCESTPPPLWFPTLRVPCFVPQAGNVVTGEMVEELILSGADIIKVGIGPGKLLYWGPWATAPVAHAPGALHCSCDILLRLRVYHPQENRSGVSTAQCRDGVCRRCSWPQRPHHLSKGHRQGRGGGCHTTVFPAVWKLW